MYLCKVCRTYYCCREHLNQDNAACHALICERQQQINVILEMPMATRSRPEVAQRLMSLQDECRRICYLQSRRHVLEEDVSLALPAAERSLQFARAVHGSDSPELVSSLLALADVASLGGAKEAASQNAGSASLLVRKNYQQRINAIGEQLETKIRYNYGCLGKIAPNFAGNFLYEEETRQSMSRMSLSSRLSISSQGNTRSKSRSNSNQTRTKPKPKQPLQQAI